MKRLLSIWIMVLFAVQPIFGQATAQKFKKTYKNQNESNVAWFATYVDDPDTNGTNLREIPGGKVGKVIHPSLEESRVFTVSLLESWEGWFRIGQEIEILDEDTLVLGKSLWIHGSLLKASTTNYDGEVLSFYQKPDRKSKVVFTVNTEVSVSFVAIEQGWAKVKYVSPTQKVYVGWIPIEQLCGNFVTNCS
ncbi:hypothetical protein ACILDS_01275 [Capnocytophaga canis]|uniref:hypothetical protein n=1 Tax=Capnocytophaga canis TaxID=1848903 RepID=UPI0037D5F868